MIIVQDSFVCKPGNASKLAKKFKEAMKDNPDIKYILTDLSGQYNRVVMVSEYESMGAYEQSWEDMQKDKDRMKKIEVAMEGYLEMYLTGSREILRVW